MGVVSLRNLHPDLKLGLVLVAAAVLLGLGASNRLTALMVAEQLDLSLTSYGWLVTVGGIGGLAVIAAAIWVDRRPPHTLMAAGAVVSVLGITAASLSNRIETAALGMFIAGAGSSAIDSLVFYAIAVKGATRYRGTLIGALAMVFTIRLRATDLVYWRDDVAMLVFVASMTLILASAALLFRFLPRVFAGPYGPGETLGEALVVPGARPAIAWLSAAFFVASMVTSTIVVLPTFNMDRTSGIDYAVLHFYRIGVFSGIGALLWGIASDFFSKRLLLLIAALLLVPTAGTFWAIDGQLLLTIAITALGLVNGGVICLPWVLMAELLPTRHFAKIALGISLVGSLVGNVLGILFWGLLQNAWGGEGVLLVVIVEAIVLALVASRLQRPQATETSVQLP